MRLRFVPLRHRDVVRTRACAEVEEVCEAPCGAPVEGRAVPGSCDRAGLVIASWLWYRRGRAEAVRVVTVLPVQPKRVQRRTWTCCRSSAVRNGAEVPVPVERPVMLFEPWLVPA